MSARAAIFFHDCHGLSSGHHAEAAMHLALDEAMLLHCEIDGGPALALRMWESSVPFVVLGAGGRVAEEVDEAECARRGIEILRRCSGGGTVVQGPGCVNFAVVLDSRALMEAATVEGATVLALDRVAEALASQGIPVQRMGISDLAKDGRKVSGNAQRRRRHHALFHGTLLLDTFDLSLIAGVLKHPPRQPEWRQQRHHLDFVAPIALDRVRFAEDFKSAWSRKLGGEIADRPIPSDMVDISERLIAEKYGSREWNRSL